MTPEIEFAARVLAMAHPSIEVYVRHKNENECLLLVPADCADGATAYYTSKGFAVIPQRDGINGTHAELWIIKPFGKERL